MFLDPTEFRSPPARHRGAPFWSWNSDLTNHDRLRRQLGQFAEMGMGGAFLHVRDGLQTEYFSEAFFDAIRVAHDEAGQLGLLTYLYDEDRWPSGYGGGEVTLDGTFRQRWIELYQSKPASGANLLAAYRITLADDGCLLGYQRIDVDEVSDHDWVAELVVAPDNPRFNDAAYLDVLNPDAVDAFIQHTYAGYRKAFGGAFPGDVPAIFTDEPQMATKPLHGGRVLPWSDALFDAFLGQWGIGLLDLLPAVLWRPVDGPSVWRWRVRDFLAKAFAETFSGRIGAWCAENGIAFTGHLMSEPMLVGQTACVGEAMRHYPHYQIPGIDLLCDRYEASTAKQTVSVARQTGRPQVLSELYGVTNWDFPFSGHKRQGDWQAALGITLRVHHLSWLSMAGSSKRDYPAAIGPQSPWYQEYRLVEDHFSRVNVALAMGKPVVRIGVIHPVESAWLHLGCSPMDGASMNEREAAFEACIHALLEGNLDFDFICESLVDELHREGEGAFFTVGDMAYEAVVLPDLQTIRTATLDALEGFMKRGGRVIIAGEIPARIDGGLSERPASVLAAAERVPLSAVALVAALEPQRDVMVTKDGGNPLPMVNYQLRREGDEAVLFCCNREETSSATRPWQTVSTAATIRVHGEWQVTELDTLSGEEVACAYGQDAGWTQIPWDCQPCSHRLLRLQPGTGKHAIDPSAWTPLGNVPEPVAVVPEEPNVVILDLAEWRLDDEPWQPLMDCMHIQARIHERFGWNQLAQPFTRQPGTAQPTLARRFTIETEIPLRGARLVCERMEAATFSINGQPVALKRDGWFVDEDLPTATLPDLAPGSHVLEVSLPLNARDNQTEALYLIGDFGVNVRGAHALIREPAETRVWGDLARQDLPFYGGNTEYTVAVEIAERGIYALRMPHIGGSLARVWCDGRDCGPVAWAPFRVELGELEPGSHQIRIRAYGNRINTFGALHNIAPGWSWWGHGAWYLEGELHNPAWQLRPGGILRAPILERQATTG